MRESIKAVLQFMIVLLLGAIAFILFAVPDQTQKVMLVIVFGLALLFCLAILIDGIRRKDKAPDHFKAMGKDRPYECKGLTFLPVFAADDSPRLDIFIQNRFDRGCRGEIYLTPPRKSFRTSHIPVPKVVVPFEVTGAEFGVVRVPYDVSDEYRGKKLVFDVAAKVSYPHRRGKMLRCRQGHRVNPPQGFASGMVSVLAIFVGIIYLSSPAKAALVMPTRAKQPEDSDTITYDTLWMLPDAQPDVGLEGPVWAGAADDYRRAS